MTDTVHVVTTLGPTDGPGLIIPAQLGPPIGHARSFLGDAMSRAREQLIDQMDQAVADALARHSNDPCHVRPVISEDS